MSALPPRQKVIPGLWFDKQAEEAVGFYVSLLPDSRIDAIIRSPGDRLCWAHEPGRSRHRSPYYTDSPEGELLE